MPTFAAAGFFPTPQSKDFVLDNGRRKIVAIVLVDMWPMIKLRATFGRKQIAKNAAVGSRAAHLIAMDDL